MAQEVGTGAVVRAIWPFVLGSPGIGHEGVAVGFAFLVHFVGLNGAVS